MRLDQIEALFIRESAARLLNSGLFADDSADADSARAILAVIPDTLSAVDIADRDLVHLFYVNRLAKGFWVSHDTAKNLIDTIDRRVPRDLVLAR